MELLLQGLGEGREGEARQRPFTCSKSGKPLLTGMGSLQALMTSSSISSGRETIVNSAADIGKLAATLPKYPCAKLQRVPHHRLAAAFRRATMDFVRCPLSRMARAAHLQPEPLRLLPQQRPHLLA